MKSTLLVTFLLVSLHATAQAAPFAKGDANAGKQTFDQHKCNSCHASKFGGDGSTIFTRKERKVTSPAALATQIRNCSTNLGLMLFEDDEENLAAYLNQNFYKFK